jgi:hypothetical protein
MQKSAHESYEDFGVMRDAWLMLEGLNDLDPFVGHPPCYVHESWDDGLAAKAS